MSTILGSLALLAVLAADAPATAPARALEISGRVLDADDRPATKVAVELTAFPSAGESRRLQLLGRLHSDLLAGTTTDGEGRFRLTAAGIGMYRVTVRATGSVPAETVLLPLLTAVELPPLRLRKDEPLRVRVTGSDGAPRAGVRVMAWSNSATSSVHDKGWFYAVRLAVSDAAGRVTLPRSRGESLELEAAGGSLAAARASRVTSAAAELRTPPGCPHQLVVRGPNGPPVEGASVLVDALVLGVTDAAGASTVMLPCGRESRLVVETQDGRGARLTLRPGTDDPPSVTPVTLEASGRIGGRVLDAESRSSLAQALVWSDGDPAEFVRTDTKGTYTLVRPWRDEATASLLRAAAAGHLPKSERAPARQGASVSGPTFALDPTATLAGRVTDSSGHPIAAAEIRIEEWSPETLFRFRPRPEGLPSRSVSGENGSFHIEVLPRRAYTLRASRAGLAPATLTMTEKLLPGAVRAGLRLVLTYGVSATGRIVNESEEPIAAAEVRLIPASPRASLPRYLRPVDESEAESIDAFSDAEGNVRFEHLRPGPFDLEAKAAGFAQRTVRGIVIESAGEPTDLGAVMLERGAALSGSVEDARGQPLAGVTVAVVPPGPAGIRGDAAARLSADDAREVLTEANGRFTIDGLTPGAAVDLTARKTGFVPGTLPRVEIPPSQPLRIILEPASRIAGHVKTEQGEPVVAAVVSARPVDAALPAGLSGRVADTDAAGAFVLEDLGTGKVALSAAARDFVSGDALVLELVEGKSLEDVQLTLRRGASIEGIVLTPGGQPATSARVTMRRNRGPDRMLDIEVAGAAQTDGDGHYRLDGVPTGPQTVTASQDGFQGAVRDLEVRSGVNRLDLRLAEGYGVSGVVVDGQGRALAGAAVTLFTAGPGSAREELSGGDGAFAFQGLGPGNYNLSGRKEGYAAARREVQVGDRGVNGLELRLQQGGGIIAGRILGVPPQSFSQLQLTAMKKPMDSLDALREGRVDAQGGFRVDGVFPGEWIVSARLPNGRQAQKTVTVTEENAEAHADLEFERGVTLSGRVRRSGQPVSHASVAATGTASDSSGSTVTDNGGAFRIEGLIAGEHELVVVAQSGLRHERVIAIASDQNVDVDLPLARVSGQVIDAATSTPLAGVPVTAEAAGGSTPGAVHPRTTSDASGRFELTGLGRGSYRITADKDGYVPGSVPVELPADDAAADGVRLSLERKQ